MADFCSLLQNYAHGEDPSVVYGHCCSPETQTESLVTKNPPKIPALKRHSPWHKLLKNPREVVNNAISWYTYGIQQTYQNHAQKLDIDSVKEQQNIKSVTEVYEAKAAPFPESIFPKIVNQKRSVCTDLCTVCTVSIRVVWVGKVTKSTMLLTSVKTLVEKVVWVITQLANSQMGVSCTWYYIQQNNI